MAVNLLDRYTKYVLKIGDGTRIAAVINSIQDTAKGNFAVAASANYNDTLAVATQLCDDGVVVTNFWAYHAFFKQLRRFQRMYNGTTLTDIVQALKDKWTSDGLSGPECILVAALAGIVVT